MPLFSPVSYNLTTGSKARLPILDGLRGVAALLVVAFHLVEMHYTDATQRPLNHAYLAVDFFFLLSGYVIGYAYDSRWGGMTPWAFMKRRLIRLHPMVVIGSLFGAALFYFSGSSFFPKVDETPVSTLLLMTVLGALLIPLRPSDDIRGWDETYPLNGPAWSLFFEYIANILYALGLRRLGLKPLAVLTVLFAGALVHLAVTAPGGSISGGWTLSPDQLNIGFTRLLFPFFGGLLLYRLGRVIRVKHALWIATAVMVAVMVAPYVGDKESPWINGLYEASMIIFVFPLVVLVGAGGTLHSRLSEKVCDFLGELSYPLYLMHYPICYIYFSWIRGGEKIRPLSETWPVALGIFVGSVVLSWLVMRYVDAPIRRRLSARSR